MNESWNRVCYMMVACGWIKSKILSVAMETELNATYG